MNEREARTPVGLALKHVETHRHYVRAVAAVESVLEPSGRSRILLASDTTKDRGIVRR